MKKILYTLLILAASFAAKASHELTNLNLSAHGNPWITVAIDHHYFGVAQRNFILSDIAPGTRLVEIFNYGYHPYSPGPYRGILFRGYVHVVPSAIITARIDKWGRFKIMNSNPKFIPCPVYAPVPPPAILPMSDYDFGMLRNSIEIKGFESTRMSIVRQVLEERHVTSRQVYQLMQLMTFESSKLELAKFAFNRVVDKERFFIVNDAFGFESSISDLNLFIRNHS